MRTTTPPARLARWVAVAAASVLLMTGCAASSGAAETEASANFPVTLDHNYGETTITEKPERVITTCCGCAPMYPRHVEFTF